MVKIVADLLGADKDETVLLEGALNTLNSNDDLFLYLCGHKDVLEAALDGKTYPNDRVEIVDCTDVITNNENPVEALVSKPEASMIKGMKLCATDDSVNGIVSCGATGGLMVTSIMILKPMGGVLPTLLCEVLRRDGKRICISDCGANIDSKAEKIVAFAKMGVAYMKAKTGLENPAVRLLSNGAEDKKGTEIVKEANSLLRQSSLNFLGNIEGSSVLEGDADVIATDGYAGNILLKSLEGGANTVIRDLKDMLKDTSMPEVQANELLDTLFKKYDYNTQGGAVLLGVKKPVVKGHGSANAKTMESIIDIAYTLAKNNVTEKVKEMFS